MALDPAHLTTAFSAVRFALSAWWWLRTRNLESKDIESTLAQIERFINKDDELIKLYGVTKNLPRVMLTGTLKVDDSVEQLAMTSRALGELNELHAVAPDWDGSETSPIHAKTCDFAVLQALRRQATHNPDARRLRRPLSANAILVCAARREILVHRRDAKSVGFPKRLHTFGGGFKPEERKEPFSIPGDRDSLEFCMVREVFEESGILVKPYGEPVCKSEERDTGWIQYVYLGVRVEKERAKLEPNTEGQWVAIGYDELPNKLHSGEWVPSGRAHVLLWLALGAPGAGLMARFNGMRPAAAYRWVLGRT